MNESIRNRLLMIVLPITMVVITSGCATRRYVRSQTGIVNQRVSELEAKTNEQMAAMSAKEQADISRVDERITTTDNRVAEVATAAQQANATAAQARQLALANQAKSDANSQAIAEFNKLAEDAWNYQLIEKGDVTFAFAKSDLGKDAKTALDLIAQRAQSMPRAVVELQGFTDKVGGKNYNLALSRRRAEAVARYLVRQNVPLRGIHIIGLGEEDPPPSLTADLQAVDPNASSREARGLARRVYIRVYAPATAIAGEAARSQP
jgi:outer membrane protein OmpA-like peptidoglycan-associated protein